MKNGILILACLTALAMSCSAIKLNELAQRIVAEDKGARLQAVNELYEKGVDWHSPRAVTLLASAIDDEDQEVRKEALSALGRTFYVVGYSPQFGHLREAILKPWICRLKDEDQGVRRQATESFVDAGYPAVTHAVGPLIAALSDEDIVVRGMAVNALAKSYDARAVEPLIGILNDENEHWAVRIVALWAVQGITGKEFTEPKVWQEWWQENKDIFEPANPFLPATH